MNIQLREKPKRQQDNIEERFSLIGLRCALSEHSNLKRKRGFKPFKHMHMKKEESHGKVIQNAAWIIGTQIIKALLGVAISMFTARYLGPTNYGLINYAASIVAFAAPIMYLGLNNTLVQEIVAAPHREGEILGTAISMSFSSSILCIAGIAAFVSLANTGEKETLAVCLLYSILLIFQSADLINYWFQAKLLSKYSSTVSLCAYLAISCYKAFLLITGKSIYWFALSNAVDYFLISGILFLIYHKVGTQRLSFSFCTAKLMLKKSKYYIVSNLMIVIYAQTDRIMLKLMIGDAETGYYSAAVYCAGMASFVFSAIIDSVRPVALAHKSENEAEFESDIISLYSVIIYLAILYSIAVSVLSPLVILLLYGKEYSAAIPVLQIIVWYCTASYLGGARDVWILARSLQKHLLLINMLGAGMNIVLNVFLIPLWGASGAAIASVITQYTINIVFTSVYKPTRRTGYLMLKGCNPKTIYRIVKSIKRGK